MFFEPPRPCTEAIAAAEKALVPAPEEDMPLHEPDADEPAPLADWEAPLPAEPASFAARHNYPKHIKKIKRKQKTSNTTDELSNIPQLVKHFGLFWLSLAIIYPGTPSNDCHNTH